MASKAPVEAPDGTAARPVLPSSRPTSTSTVGLPRESRISRATTTSMDGTSISFLGCDAGSAGRVPCGRAVRLEPNRPRGAGHRPTVPWTGGTRRRYLLFTAGTKGGAGEHQKTAGQRKAPPRRVRGNTRRGGEPVGTGVAL